MNTYTPNTKVLYVDDEPSLLSAFTSLFRREGLQIHTLDDSTRIDRSLEHDGPFALVISDQRMPGLDGVGTLERVQLKCPATSRVMLTGFADQEDTVRAINTAGISRYMTKPWDDTLLRQMVHECVDAFNLTGENQYLTRELAVQNKTLQELLEGTVGQTVQLLSHLITYINVHAANQTDRVRKLGNAVLTLCHHISPEERWEIQRALELFNLGIAVLPPWIQVTLGKEGLWSLPRFPVAQHHHLLAYDLLKDIPRFDRVARIIQLSHKDFDGEGEPKTVIVKGPDIPLGARLLRILIDLDSLSTEHYRGRDMLQKMLNQRKKYDAELISLMLGLESSMRTSHAERRVTIEELEEGMIIVDDMVTTRGHVMIRAGSELTKPVLRILSQTRHYDPIKEPVTVRANVLHPGKSQ
jgi:response regulator RpfG family c-di-GMP phosphodiesterase